MIAFELYFIFDLFACNISADNRYQLLITPGKAGTAKANYYFLFTQHPPSDNNGDEFSYFYAYKKNHSYEILVRSKKLPLFTYIIRS